MSDVSVRTVVSRILIRPCSAPSNAGCKLKAFYLKYFIRESLRNFPMKQDSRIIILSR